MKIAHYQSTVFPPERRKSNKSFLNHSRSSRSISKTTTSWNKKPKRKPNRLKSDLLNLMNGFSTSCINDQLLQKIVKSTTLKKFQIQNLIMDRIREVFSQHSDLFFQAKGMDLEEQLLSLQSKLDVLKGATKKQKNQVRKLQGENKILSSKVAELEVELRAKNEDIRRMGDELSGREKEINEIQSTILDDMKMLSCRVEKKEKSKMEISRLSKMVKRVEAQLIYEREIFKKQRNQIIFQLSSLKNKRLTNFQKVSLQKFSNHLLFYINRQKISARINSIEMVISRLHTKLKNIDMSDYQKSKKDKLNIGRLLEKLSSPQTK